jgi:xanthine dehydrogenase YagS FAD-binding subunit
VKPFRFARAVDPESALALADAPGARFLGGGTNLVDLMRLGVETPESLVDVSRLPYDRVEALPSGGMLVGAAVRNADLAAHPAIRERYPVLAQALLAGASGQLRNLATTAGNLLQRTRCLYFQDITKPCNKRAPGSGCPAREGDHRGLAVLGHSEHCVATHPSDMAVALTALGATVHVRGHDGERAVPMPGFHRLPGAAPERDTVLGAGELITGVELPPLAFGHRSAYRKVRDRAAFAFAIVSVAAALDIDDGKVREARLALGGVAHAPWRAEAAEAALRDAPATPDAFRAAADAELAAAEPLRDNAFKVPLARDLIVHVLSELTEVA